MALYSWFLGTDKKSGVKTNKSLRQATQSVKYIDNYTMWPTAKIKSNIEPSAFNKSKKPTSANTTKSNDISLTMIKRTINT